MAKRPAYKALYLAEQAQRQDAESQRDVYKRELREYQEALAPYGQKTLEAQVFSPSYEPIPLAPMEFVAMKAFMELSIRIERIVTGGVPVLPMAFSWRGRPIHRETTS